MPAEKYNFVPPGEGFAGVRTFGEQVRHVATMIYMTAAIVLEEKTPYGPGRNDKGPDGLKSKEEILNYLDGSLAYARKAIAALSEKEDIPHALSFEPWLATEQQVAAVLIEVEIHFIACVQIAMGLVSHQDHDGSPRAGGENDPAYPRAGHELLRFFHQRRSIGRRLASSSRESGFRSMKNSQRRHCVDCPTKRLPEGKLNAGDSPQHQDGE
jgi:hypothetical protein